MRLIPEPFIVGQLYKHRNNSDVAFKVITTRQIDNGYRLQVHWFNIVSPHHHWCIDSRIDEILITSDQLDNWRDLYEYK